jgi:hypothetical protein
MAIIALAPVKYLVHDLLGPGLPNWPVAVPVSGHYPARRVAHLVHQGVPQPVGRVQHLGGQLDPAQPLLGARRQVLDAALKGNLESDDRGQFFTI